MCPYRRCHPRSRLPHDRVCSKDPTRTQTKPTSSVLRRQSRNGDVSALGCARARTMPEQHKYRYGVCGTVCTRMRLICHPAPPGRRTDALGSSSHQMRTPDRSHSDDSSSSRRRVRGGGPSGGFVASVCPYRRCHPRSRLPHDRVCSRDPTRTQTKPTSSASRRQSRNGDVSALSRVRANDCLSTANTVTAATVRYRLHANAADLSPHTTATSY